MKLKKLAVGVLVIDLLFSANIKALEIQTKEALQSKISANKKDYTSLTLLANIYLTEGDKKKALAFLNRAVKIDPGYPYAHFLLGKCNYLLQNNDQAELEFNTYKELMFLQKNIDLVGKSAHIQNLHYISEIYFAQKKYDEAKMEIDDILTLNPNDQYAIYNLGVYHYVYSHNRSKAYEMFNKVIKLDPDSFIAGKAKYAIEFMRANPDPRVAPDFSFIDKE